MSAKLHQALAYNTLKVRNISSGEVILYFQKPDGKLGSVTLRPHSETIDLLSFAEVATWKKSPNLKDLIHKSYVDVIL